MESSEDLKLKTIEINLKHHELVTRGWELYNNYVQDLRSRIDSVVKAVLLVSGGALTVSAGIFLRLDRPKIYPELIPVLQNGWLALGASMLLMIALVIHLIIIGSLHADRWHATLQNPERKLIQPSKVARLIGWTIGLSGIACCFTGIGSLVYIARKML